MGFFSWECKKCGVSIISHWALPRPADGLDLSWQTRCVVIEPGGSVIRGEYDGYGRVESGSGRYEIELDVTPCMYHEACYEADGCPGYAGPSKSAMDQGYFFDLGDHDIAKPLGKT